MVSISDMRNIQNFLGQNRWAGSPLLEKHRIQISNLLENENGVLILDGRNSPQQGKESVSVNYQTCREADEIINFRLDISYDHQRNAYTKRYHPKK